MLIIVTFLFLQSVWFGLAGVALIPLQAYLIPYLQRQINLLNKERIKEVRHFAAEIGETAAGITELRTNGGLRYRLAAFTHRLNRLFEVRFQIYQKKFFMKFLNNFITQLTPFFFYAVGGYLAIQGQITVGALVAALAAYKDLSSPWKELLAYYNQTQDMSLRWEIVTERFAPKAMIDEKLIEGHPDEIPQLRGNIEFSNVTFRNADGNAVLEDLSLDIPAGSHVAIETSAQSERTALAELLTREAVPTRGTIHIAGYNLSELHQAVIAARIGYAHAQPYLFQGRVKDNLMMSLRTSPQSEPDHRSRAVIEARRSGNSPDPLDVEWLDPSLAELKTSEEVYEFWYSILQALGSADFIFRGRLKALMDPDQHPELAQQIVGLRSKVRERLKEKELDKYVHRFDPDVFNPGVPLGGNLMFAAPRHEISQESLVSEKGFLGMIMELGLGEQGIAISQTLIEMLHQTFGRDGTNHPLFTALGIEDTLYEKLVDIAARRRDDGDAALSEDEFALLLTVPFAFTAEQIGPSFPESFKQEILKIRKDSGADMRQRAADLFIPIAPENYLPRLTILENLLYGRISSMAGLQGDMIEDVVAGVVEEHDLKRDVCVNLLDTPTTIGGANLPSVFQQRAAFTRAVIKRPDVLVFNQTLIVDDPQAQAQFRDRLAALLPHTTQIYINDRFADPDSFDLHVKIQNGRLEGVAQSDLPPGAEDGSDDLRRKLRIIGRNELFGSLDARNQRLLAFAAQWYTAEKGSHIFSVGERPDAAYLCLSGMAELVRSDDTGRVGHVSYVEPGRLIGDLAIIIEEPRQLDLVALEDTKFLRIGAEEFRAVVENDTTVMMSLLRTVGGYLTNAAELMIAAGIEVPREMPEETKAEEIEPQS
jgi:putative ABC transport system ATP-binding protein